MAELMNIQEEQAKMRDKFARRKRGAPPQRKLSLAVENRKLEAQHQKKLERSGQGFASGKEIADAIGKLFD